MEAAASSAPPTSAWVILGSIPRVLLRPRDEEKEKEEEEARGSSSSALSSSSSSDSSLALTPPPRVSRLTVSDRVFPKPPTPRHFPFLLATDPSGLLLLSAIVPRPAPVKVFSDRGNGNNFFYWSDTEASYFVLDAASGGSSALRLPDPAHESILHQALLGILASPAGGGHYMVAELRPFIGSDHGTLLCFSSDLGEWIEKEVHYPLPPRPLSPIATISHHGRLWWVDLSWGIITADPFADRPVLGFVPFPPGRVLESREAWGVTDKFRYVGVSDGKLRFVDTYMGRRRPRRNEVTVWTLPDPDSKDWVLQYRARFADIWADATYAATGLPKKVPILALIHPKDPRVVYFSLDAHLFAVDVQARKVVHCEAYSLVAPPQEYMANRFLRAWDLPRAVSSGMVNWSNGMSLMSETAAPRRPPAAGRESRSKGMKISGLPGDYHLVGITRQTFTG